jgi:hypothetical protein
MAMKLKMLSRKNILRHPNLVVGATPTRMPQMGMEGAVLQDLSRPNLKSMKLMRKLWMNRKFKSGSLCPSLGEGDGAERGRNMSRVF